MKRKFAVTVLSIVCAITALVLCPVKGQENATLPESRHAKENVRLIFEVISENGTPAIYSIVTRGNDPECIMYMLKDPLSSDESKLPIFLKFRAQLTKIDDSTYEVDYDCVTDRPVYVEETATEKSHHEYRDFGPASIVNAKFDQKIEIFSEPNSTIYLEIQRVDVKQ